MRAICACVLLAAGAVQAAGTGQLQARDIDGNGSVDAYFDTAQNITWLADSNPFGKVQGMHFGPPPFGMDGWRLPVALSVLDPTECTSVGSTGGGMSCIILSSELSELDWNGAPFLNTHPTSSYWLGSQFGDALGVYTGGHHSVTNESDLFMYAWPVHDGDVGAAVLDVPEPSTYALMVAGLIALRFWSARSGSQS